MTAIIIRGKSPTPVYLSINDDDVQLRDAAHLWGKGTPDTMQAIRDELGNSRVHIACIGPAGENKCYAASIESAVGAGASRGGAGAVMGDKNLKAIAAYGTRDVRVAKPQRLVQLCEEVMERSGPLNKIMERFNEAVIASLVRDGLYGNLDEGFIHLSPDSEFRKALEKIGELAAEWVGNRDGQGSCHNCGFKCRQAFRHPGGGISYIKCGSWTCYAGACKLFDYDFVLECYRLSLHYGLDTMSTSRHIAFAIDLYQKGILTKADTDGMHLEYGNREIVYSLIEKIGKREGIGDLLANGVHEAARQIGRGAEDHVHLTKKLDIIQDANLGLYLPHMAMNAAISDRADAARLWNGNLLDFHTAKGDKRKAVVDSVYWNYPEEYKSYFLAEPSLDGADYEPLCQFVAYEADRYTILDMTGICSFWGAFVGFSPFNGVALIAELTACATGLDFDEAELMAISGRTLSLMRADNIRNGLTKKDDSLPKPFYKLPPPSGFKNHDPKLVAKWVERYYELKGVGPGGCADPGKAAGIRA